MFTGCNKENNQRILTCLQKVDHLTISKYTTHFEQNPCHGPVVWKPYFDGYNVSRPVFHDYPENLLRSGNYNKVPIMIGTTSDEGAYYSMGYLNGKSSFEEVIFQHY